MTRQPTPGVYEHTPSDESGMGCGFGVDTPAPELNLLAWQPIETAPKDGTRILIWFVHANARFSKDPIAEGWAAAHEAHWIDHNGGGWTWHGICGVATLWQPLPNPPVTTEGQDNG